MEAEARWFWAAEHERWLLARDVREEWSRNFVAPEVYQARAATCADECSIYCQAGFLGWCERYCQPTPFHNGELKNEEA